MNGFKTKDRVITKFGETGTIIGKTWNNQFEVEIDNSEDTHKIKRWLGNKLELYRDDELKPLK